MPPALVPELKVTDLDRSLHFDVPVLGFEVVYDRPEERSASLSRGRADVMLEQVSASDHTRAGDLETPFGRGVSFQIEVTEGLHALVALLDAAGTDPFLPRATSSPAALAQPSGSQRDQPDQVASSP